MKNRPLHPPSRGRQDQRGVALVIALILILVMSLLGTFAIRNATQSERSINGIRTAEVARESAETALRFCEQIAIFDGNNQDYSGFGTSGLRSQIIATTITSEADAAAAWRTAGNWTSTNTVISVPASYYQKYSGGSADASVPRLKNPPLCLIQKIQSTSTPQIKGYLITGRGFANNAVYNASTGKSTQGAEAWIQSILTRDS